MEQIVINNVTPELKKKFKIYVAGECANMTQVLIKYIESVTKDIRLPNDGR